MYNILDVVPIFSSTLAPQVLFPPYVMCLIRIPSFSLNNTLLFSYLFNLIHFSPSFTSQNYFTIPYFSFFTKDVDFSPKWQNKFLNWFHSSYSLFFLPLKLKYLLQLVYCTMNLYIGINLIYCPKSMSFHQKSIFVGFLMNLKIDLLGNITCSTHHKASSNAFKVVWSPCMPQIRSKSYIKRGPLPIQNIHDNID